MSTPHRRLPPLSGPLAWTALCLVGGVAIAQELPEEEAPPPQAATKYIIVPDPFEELEEAEKAKAGARPRARRTAEREPSVPPRITRDTPRPVNGDAPDNVWGRYEVVEVTQAGITEDSRNKRERAGRALNEDCIVTRSIFDFGPLPSAEEGEAPSGHRPKEVELTQVRECDVGGLGKYAEEVTMVVPATWMEGEGSVTLELPRVRVVADFVRLSPPRDGDMRTPPQWLAPDTSLESGAESGGDSYVMIAERARRGALPVLHLTTVDQVLHLEAAAPDERLDAVHADVPGQP